MILVAVELKVHKELGAHIDRVVRVSAVVQKDFVLLVKGF